MSADTGEQPSSDPGRDGEDFDAVAAPLRQQQHLRRILLLFLIVVVLLPFVALGGAWSLLLLPLLICGALALREAIRLRRSVNRYGSAPPHR